ncbi:hypothetical protein CWS02_25015 [Enterobacter sp. EA-1]|nr:hypothetical protein CWS02_25015 [Enterobacter sp. EA-1]
MKRRVVIGVLGTVLDKRGKRQNRFRKWRPTVGLCQQPVSRSTGLNCCINRGIKGWRNRRRTTLRSSPPIPAFAHMR